MEMRQFFFFLNKVYDLGQIHGPLQIEISLSKIIWIHR
jgi:hypothetical protein